MAYRPRPTGLPSRPLGPRPIYSRRGGPRYLVRRIAVVVTLVVLIALVFRACSGGGGGTSVDAAAYMDSVRVYVQKSNEIGTAWKRLPQNLNTFDRDSLSKQLTDLQKQSSDLISGTVTAFPTVPQFAIAAQGYLLTTFRARAQGLKDVTPAILQANVTQDEGFAIQTFRSSLVALQASDLTYGYFKEEINRQLAAAKQKSEVPESTFIAGSDFALPDKQDGFVKALRDAEKLKATQNLGIAGIKTDPDQQGQDGEVFRLPASPSFELRVTVTNKGNVRSDKVVSSTGSPQQTDSTTIDSLDPGDSKVAVLRGLNPDRGDAVNLIEIEVVAAGDADPTDNSKSFKFTMQKTS
jgi:hypothetical protein